jgi:hypothetical protein
MKIVLVGCRLFVGVISGWDACSNTDSTTAVVVANVRRSGSSSTDRQADSGRFKRLKRDM